MLRKKKSISFIFIDNGGEKVRNIINKAQKFEIIFLPIQWETLRKKLNNVLPREFVKSPSIDELLVSNRSLEEIN